MTATTTWTLVRDVYDACGRFMRNEGIYGDRIDIYSPLLAWSYRPAGPGQPVAFTYDEIGWTYVGTFSNCCVTTGDPPADPGFEGF